MSRRPRGTGNTRGGRGGGRGGGGIVVVPPGPEAPELVPGLKAWFDSRDPAYFTFGFGTEVAAWASRAGSIAGVSWVQAASASRPLRNPSVPELGGRPAVQFDGVDDSILTNNQNAWAFLHNGSGYSRFMVWRIDSTGAIQRFGQTSTSNAVGAQFLSQATSVTATIASGGATANGWTINAAPHYARNVSRWQMFGYATGTQHARVSNSSLTNADTGAPSVANPAEPYRIGTLASGIQPLKGWIAQDVYYDHVLSEAETAQLADWARAQYGVQGATEAPALIPGLKCWFDGRDAVLTTSSGITSVVGSMGTISLGQVTPAQRPLYVTSVPQFGGRAALQFDGVDDNLVGTVPADWTFLHNGSGASVFWLEWIDSTGPSTQVVFSTTPSVDPLQSGVYSSSRTSNLITRLSNGTAAFFNNWTFSNAAHWTRDVARWRGWSYDGDAMGSHVAGSSVTNPDTAGVPSAAAPQSALRLGNTSNGLKGFMPQLIIYDRVLTPAEWASLGAWAASQYPGVVA